MEKIKNISLIGLGAIGATYASKLYDMDPDCIKIIVNKERIKRYNSDGIIVNNKGYDFNYIDAEEKCEPADLVIIAVKFNHLEQAIEDIKNHVGPNTIILSLLNGITSEKIIGSRYGMEKMLYGICLGIDALRVGRTVRTEVLGKICFGDEDNLIYSHNVQVVRELFDQAKIPYEIPENMNYMLWKKFMINVGINQTSAALRAPYGVFQKVKEAQELMEGAMSEVIELSQKLGINLQQREIKEWYKLLDRHPYDGKTSMLQDIEAGRKTEIGMFAGVICEYGKKYGIGTPINAMLYKIIRTMEQMNQLEGR